MTYLEEIEGIAIREVGNKLYEEGLTWAIKPNPMRSDGVFVVCNEKDKSYFYQVPEEFAKKLIHFLNVEIPMLQKLWRDPEGEQND